MMTAFGKTGTQRFDAKRVNLPISVLIQMRAENGRREMQSFLGRLQKAPGHVAMFIAVAISTAAALTAVIAVSSMVGRVEKLESDLAKARSDLDHPRVRPLASIANSGPFLRQ
jgi:hypothetical protein